MGFHCQLSVSRRSKGSSSSEVLHVLHPAPQSTAFSPLRSRRGSMAAEEAPPLYKGGWLVILLVSEVIDLRDLSAAPECASEVLA